MQNDLPKGFRAGAAAASFKKAGRDDLGIIVSDTSAVLALRTLIRLDRDGEKIR